MGLFNFFRSTDINAGVAEYKTTDGAVLLTDTLTGVSMCRLIKFLPLRTR